MVSFAVALSGFGLAELTRQLAHGARLRRRAVPAALALAPTLVSVFGSLFFSAGPVGPEITVAAIQGNVPRLGLDFNAQRRAVLDNHVRRTQILADDAAAGSIPRPDLVIWHENSSDIDPFRNSDAAAQISAAASAIGVPIEVGAVLVNGSGPQATNTSLTWEPGIGPTARIDKRRVVPFGEYLPWRSAGLWVGVAQSLTWGATLLTSPWWGRRNDVTGRPLRSFVLGAAGCGLAIAAQSLPIGLIAVLGLRIAQGACFGALAQSLFFHASATARADRASGAVGSANSFLLAGHRSGL
ncbi:MAG: hypothetical protein M3Z25_02100 [Actinomycetota bacterium]|nr:hypothetical protein [Actinomycetota bacterium]